MNYAQDSFNQIDFHIVLLKVESKWNRKNNVIKFKNTNRTQTGAFASDFQNLNI